MKPKKPTLKEIEDGILDADPNAKTDMFSFQAAVIMIAATYYGQCVKTLEKITKVPSNVIEIFKTNLEKGKVWKKGKTYAEWDDPELGGAAFWMDVCVATGIMEKVR